MPLDNPDKTFLTFHDVEEDDLCARLLDNSLSISFASAGGGTAEVLYPRRRAKDACFLEARLAADALHKKLKSLQSKARESVEEKGVNTLYLSLGICTWTELKNQKEHHAPILLVPVKLVKDRGLKKPFRLVWNEEDVELNPCLEVLARNDWGVALPALDPDALAPSDYLAKAARKLKRGTGFQVRLGTTGLGLFDFTKLSIYRDLDAQRWPSEEVLIGGPLGALITGAVASAQDDAVICETGSLGSFATGQRLDHIADADESQAKVIELARQGHQVVVQGPPGTGKSQTITNMIATSVLDGKTVLFVCEKSAALEVVRDRLEAAGLGSILLELHSEKATKKAVLSNLQATWETGLSSRFKQSRPAHVPPDRMAAELDDFVAALHTAVGNTGLSPYQLAANLAAIDGHQVTARLGIPDLTSWDASRLEFARNTARQLAACFNRIIDPAHNPWANSGRTARVSPGDARLLEHKLSATVEEISDLRSASGTLSDRLGFAAPCDIGTIKHLLKIAETAGGAPDAAIYCSFEDVSTQSLEEIVIVGASDAGERKELFRIFGRESLEALPESQLAALQKSGTLRGFLDIRCHWAKRKLLGTARSFCPPETLDGLPARIVRFRDWRKRLEQISTDGAKYFGAAWNGADSNWHELSRFMAWRKDLEELGVELPTVRQLAAVADKEAVTADTCRLRALLERLEPTLGTVADQLGIPRLQPTVFDATTTKSLEAQVKGWRDNISTFPAWVDWRLSCSEADGVGLGDLVYQLNRGTIHTANAEATLRFSYYRALLELAQEERASLAAFRSERHEDLIEQFCEADRAAVHRAKRKVLEAYLSRLPEWETGEAGAQFLRDEFSRKARHRPVRTLLEQAGGLIQRIKPVFMMSPLSVAKYLSPGGLTFDLLVVDEASQIPPVEAFGAIARTRQHAVVGDQKQLPPTSFFARTMADEDQDDEAGDDELDASRPPEMESILSLCAARGFRPAMLRWHFRSQHESLIHFSNLSFYNAGLLVPPSPDRDPSRKGLSFVHVPEGVYRDRTNENEARVIAEAVAAHAEMFPELSLGVVAFSEKQKEVIKEYVDKLAEKNARLADFQDEHKKGSPFFIKNLENVQGDERDVIFISFCYGRGTDGKFAQQFGPVIKQGGERRLNVIATRAKIRCVLYASVKSSDFPDKIPHGTPRRHLMEFMAFAEQCSAPRGDRAVRADTGTTRDSVITQVARRLAADGYSCTPLGADTGCKIDLAVVDPANNSRLLLAILTDDLAYGSMAQARDRDRLHAQILQNVGWDNIVRVWTLDWWHDPDAQMERILGCLRDRDERHATTIPATIGDASESDSYLEAERPEPPLSFLSLTPRDLAGEIRKILVVEAPMHPKLLNERLKDFLAIERLDEPTKRRIANAIEILKTEGSCEQLQDQCLSIPGATMRLRNRNGLNPKHAADVIPEAEIRLAAEMVILKHLSWGEDAVEAAALALGYQRLGEPLKHRLRGTFRKLKKERQQSLRTTP